MTARVTALRHSRSRLGPAPKIHLSMITMLAERPAPNVAQPLAAERAG
jgi:hypothetical protein